MNMHTQEQGEFTPAIHRARIKELTIYEISGDELNTIEKGSPESIYFSSSVAFITSAISLLASFIVADIESNITRTIFIIIIVIGFTGGTIFLGLWKRSSSSVAECIKTIRGRLPPPEGSRVGE